MNPSGQVDLSVIIVNYNVAPLVLEAVASLQRQKFASQDGNEGHLEILVIDNASSPEDVACLKGLASSVVLLRNDRNMGFAAANNQGIERASGRYLCFLNPDTQVLDGALDALLQYLYRYPEVGAVGARIWADDERTLLLPPGDSPTLSFLLSGLAGAVIQAVAKRHGLVWHRRAITYWRTSTPFSVTMLSGACIMTPRAVVNLVGWFDPGYFLYYEDADWCRRVCRAGYRLAVVPQAGIVHYYNQSAKLDPRRAQGHAFRSQARFVRAHYGMPGMLIYLAARAMSDRVTRWRCPAVPHQLIDLGHHTEPPRLCLTEGIQPLELMVEIGYDCLLLPSAAAFVRQADFQLPLPVWERMQPGRYYARMIDPETLRVLALWSWRKS